MAATTLVFLKQLNSVSGPSVDTLTIDATLSETHSSKVTVTRHPVEQGVKITDHKLREPDGLVMDCIITNDPMPTTDSETPAQYVNPSGQTFNYAAKSSYEPDRASKAYQTLLSLLDSPDLLSVVTSLRNYDNMVLTDITAPRDSGTGEALRFTVTFTQIRVVQNQTTVIQAKTTRASGNKDLHKKVTPEAATAQTKKSMLKSITHSDFAKHPLDSVANAFGGGNKVGF